MQPHRQQPTRLLYPCDSPGKNTGVGCHFPLQHWPYYLSFHLLCFVVLPFPCSEVDLEIRIWVASTIVPLILIFFSRFKLPVVNLSLKLWNGKFWNKQFISFRLCAILSTVMKYAALLCPAQDVNHFFVQLVLPNSPSFQTDCQWHCRAVFK